MVFFALLIVTVFLAEDATALVTRFARTQRYANNGFKYSSNLNIHQQQQALKISHRLKSGYVVQLGPWVS